MVAYYSEFDPFAAAWLRELIAQKVIAEGVVDERDLWDVKPSELKGYTQVHLCAGIGVWSYALRRAGWGDSRPCWTASLPCQPFSAAGKGEGFADKRHLWPAAFHLISQCRPKRLFGEQVASKDAEPWIDLVQDDLEALGYAVGAVPFPSAGVGAPHIRDRLYWVAESGGERREGQSVRLLARRPRQAGVEVAGSGTTDGLAHHHHPRLEGRGQPGRERGAERAAREGGVAGGVADANRAGAERRAGNDGQAAGLPKDERQPEHGAAIPQRASEDGGGLGVHRSGGLSGDARPAGPTNSLWRDADWLLCRDGKWRPVRFGSFPLVARSSESVGRDGDLGAQVDKGTTEARVGRLRGYGNAINAQAATVWIETYLDAIGG